MKILVVEDETIVAWDIKETLEKLGHKVVDLATSGAAAIQAATHQDPDLVLMDIRLAGEMDGITAGNEIYQRLKIPVVYLSAHADEITLSRAIKTAPFGYIVKPFQAQTLQSTIQVACQRHYVEASKQMMQASLGYLLDNMGSGIIVADRQGLVTFLNPIAQTLTGWNSAEAVGVEIDRVFCVQEIDGTAIENPSSQAMRLQAPIKSPEGGWLRSKDGVLVPISNTATPILQQNGAAIGSIVIFQDNSKQVSIQMDLHERNQDLELFQLRFISQLQAKTAEFEQATAFLGVWDLLLDRVTTAQTEVQLLQSVLEYIGKAISADYCWIALHDPLTSTATICCEYIDRARPIYPTSKLGKQIDIQLYPEFYHHLFTGKSWVDLPAEITPPAYLNLLTPSALVSIFPLGSDLPNDRDLAAQSNVTSQQPNLPIIGEVGIITTGRQPWTLEQTSPTAQVLGGAIKLFRQNRYPFDPAAKSLDLLDKLLDSLDEDLTS